MRLLDAVEGVRETLQSSLARVRLLGAAACAAATVGFGWWFGVRGRSSGREGVDA